MSSMSCAVAIGDAQVVLYAEHHEKPFVVMTPVLINGLVKKGRFGNSGMR